MAFARKLLTNFLHFPQFLHKYVIYQLYGGGRFILCPDDSAAFYSMWNLQCRPYNQQTTIRNIYFVNKDNYCLLCVELQFLCVAISGIFAYIVLKKNFTILSNSFRNNRQLIVFHSRNNIKRVNIKFYNFIKPVFLEIIP